MPRAKLRWEDRPPRSAIIGRQWRTMAPISEADLTSVRVLIPTSRHLYGLVSYGMVIDFEDAVASASDADLVHVPLYSRRDTARRLLRGRPPRPVTPPRSDYHICLLVAMAGDWLPSLRYVRNLRAVADKVIVYLFDSWLSDLPVIKRYGAVWQVVDDLFVSFEHARASYSAALPCRVHYLPQAIEPKWFHPYRSSRAIDVLSVGRRLPTVHRSLLQVARDRDLFYFYQTHRTPHAIDFTENQALLGRLCQSSRVHVSWSVDRTNPARASEGGAITARWFESAACAAAVIGAGPTTAEFARLFPCPGFVREITDPSVSGVARSIDAAFVDSRDEARLALAEHVRQAHTWAVRWREIVAASAA